MSGAPSDAPVEENLLASLAPRLLFDLYIEGASIVSLGLAGGTEQRFANVTSGRYVGPELNGRVLPGASDSITVRPDRVQTLDVRMVLEQDDGQRIAMTYRGYRAPPGCLRDGFLRGERVSSWEMVYRTAHFFHATGSLDWLNDVVAFGLGRRTEAGVSYSVFRLD